MTGEGRDALERPGPTLPRTDRAVAAGAVFLVVFTPLAFGTVTPWAEAVAETVVLAMTVLWVLGMVRQWQLRIAIPPGALPALLFVSLGLVQMIPIPVWLAWIVSPRAAALATEVAHFTGAPLGPIPSSLAPYATWQQWTKLVATGLFFLVVYNTHRTRPQARRLLWAMLLTTAAIALFGIVQRATWNGRLYWIGPVAPHASGFGPFVNRAHFAGLVVVVAPMGLAMMLGLRRLLPRPRVPRAWRDRVRAWSSRNVGPERLIPLLILLAGGAALVSGSRGGVVSLLCALVAMAGLGAHGREGGRRAGALAAATLVVVLVSLWIGGDIVYGTAARLTEELGALQESPRVRLWQDAVALWRTAPIIGTGLASFGVAFEPYRTLQAPVVFSHAESDWVQLLTDTGLVGVALVIAVFVALAVSLLRRHRRAANPWDQTLALGALVALLGTGAQWIANYNLPVMSNLLYLAAAVAVALPLEEGPA
jgi:O-antigen ligase